MCLKRYFIYTIDHSGSAFLSKVLNSHFEVIYFHEFGYSLRHAQFYEFSLTEKLNNYNYLLGKTNHYKDTYKVIGTVEVFFHKVSFAIDEIVDQLPSDLQNKIFFFYWVRHPVLMINSSYKHGVKSPVGKGYLKKLEDDLRRLEEIFQSDFEIREVKKFLKLTL
ncbi:MAG: hypothetical protein LWW94_10455 [Candidatus Desulfofervidaceae bacterium]|nr:hypothetical protein [Candidatus Desulfofervidaceae bacterium]